MYRITVRYPAAQGDAIVLRTSLDWERDLPATAVRDEGRSWVFEFPAEGVPRLHFKACRRRDGELRWSVGANHLAIRGERSVYPHFDGGAAGRISDRLTFGERVARVYTPPGYAENTLKRYPVIYVHDGANAFFPEEAFSGVDWRVDETLDLLDPVHVVDRVVVVATHAAPDRRMTEYTPPGWSAWAEELVGVVKPAVDREYRTLPGPETTAVMGSSLGGVVSFWLAWSHPHVFGLAACLSPSFGLRDELEREVWRGPVPRVRIYLDSGWPGDNHEATVAMREALLSRGFTMGRDLLHLCFPGAPHHESAWADRVHLPVQFLFGQAFRDHLRGHDLAL